MTSRITLVEGDITDQEVDAIVNAANSALKLGGGVAGAIRAKAGPQVQAECDAIGSIAVGSAAITAAGDLPARYVIHAAAMSLGGSATEASIHGSLRVALELANENQCRSIAIPAIGAGIGGFPTQRCAEILLAEVNEHLAGETTLEHVRFVLYGEPTYRIFESAWDAEKIRAQMERLRSRS